jgi:hypothetical protein
MKQSTYAKIQCDKCHQTAAGVTGHIGKRHKACGKRKPGFSKADCGVWARA